jgi:glucosamine kinase
MSFFLAIDAGGTKTDYVVADETRVLARVRTGTIKRMRTDADSAAFNLDSGLHQLAELSGVTMQSITRTCIGTAGERVPLVADWLRVAMAARVSGELLLLGDVEIALDAAFRAEAGVLVLAGTGSNVAGRLGHGEMTSAGGWGPALADQGSGQRIGLESLRAAFLAKDEGRPTRLLNDVMDFWDLMTLDLLIEYANRIPPPDFSRLTELVVWAAEMGDEVATEVLVREGESLAFLVRLVIRRLQHMARNREWVPSIAFAGSVMEKVPAVRKALITAVEREFGQVTILETIVDPIAGAVWRARHCSDRP